MSPNLHEDAFGVSDEPGIDCRELWPPVSGSRIPVATIKILIPRDSSILRGIGVANTDLYGTNEVSSLS